MAKISERITSTIREIGRLLINGDKNNLRTKILALHPRDQAKYLLDNSQTARQKVYDVLEPNEMAKIFEHIELRKRLQLFEELEIDQASQVLTAMYVDDAVDILRRLESEKSAEYMSMLEDELESSIRNLLHYKERTAGSLMTTEFIKLKTGQTASQALEQLQRQASRVVTVYYAFVVDDSDHLIGVVSLKDLLTARKDALVETLGNHRVISVQATASGVEAARVIKEYNFLALPVVNDDNNIIGVITVDDIVDVIDAQAGERYQRLGAATNIELTDGPLTSAKKRLPWLILLLFLGMITATLIGQFEDTIAKVAILGAFIPVVAGTTGNSGTQSLAIMVRGIATGKMAELSVRRYLLKEMATALATSIVCGIVLFGIIFFWKQELTIGIVAGGALTISIFAGSLVGTIVPLTLKKLHVDPAVASGPLITTICDIISMGIYFTIAAMLMSQLTA